MRSSIACLRCRKSKIKCDNTGGTSPCETCIKVGHHCQYPDAIVPQLKRGDPSGGSRTDKETAPERKRARKTDDASPKDSQQSTVHSTEIFSYSFLTEEVWDQIFAIYKLHFASELPFLHLPTLKEAMSRHRGEDTLLPECSLVFLGVLALTVPFHADLVKYVSHLPAFQSAYPRMRSAQAKPDPIAASDFFAHALVAALGPTRASITHGTVVRVQAYLMLALHEWRQRRPDSGIAAWMYVGIATRLAQTLKLSSENTLRGRVEDASRVHHAEGCDASGDVGITREVKRRTMFSCLIMDRMLACGVERPAMIRVEDLQIQLPCTEMAFDLALDVHTGFLRSPRQDRYGSVTDDSVLSRFVQLMEIWGNITRYSIQGGRLAEQVPPWDTRATFRQLQHDLDVFNDQLPETFKLSRQNYYRHDNHQAHSMYVSLHMLVSLCQIMLHREHLPFLPLRSRQPEGPLDATPWSGTDAAPGGFWVDSAERVFRAARDTLDLIDISRDKLPVSSLTLLAAWTSGVIGLYASHFPAMDTKLHMRVFSHVETGNSSGDGGLMAGPIGLAMSKMAAYLPRAEGYIRFAESLNVLFSRAKGDFEKLSESGRSPSIYNTGERLSIRLGSEKEASTHSSWGWQPSRTSSGIAPALQQHIGHPHEVPGRPMPLGPDAGSPEMGKGMDRPSSIPRPAPSLGFTAINNQSQMQPESGPLIGAAERDWWPRGEQYLSRTASESQSEVGLGLMSKLKSQAPFNLDDLGGLESQRMGTMLNDLREFSGAGSLGGEWWSWDGQ